MVAYTCIFIPTDGNIQWKLQKCTYSAKAKISRLRVEKGCHPSGATGNKRGF